MSNNINLKSVYGGCRDAYSGVLLLTQYTNHISWGILWTNIYDGKLNFLQNSDIVLDNSISYSLEKEDPAFAGQISYSPTPFPNTPITSNNNTPDITEPDSQFTL